MFIGSVGVCAPAEGVGVGRHSEVGRSAETQLCPAITTDYRWRRRSGAGRGEQRSCTPGCGAGDLAFRALCGLGRGGGPVISIGSLHRMAPSSSTRAKTPSRGMIAVTGLVIDRAAVVALLADLGDFHDRLFAEADAGADGRVFQSIPTVAMFLGKVAETDIEPLRAGQIDAFGGQKTHLAVPRGRRGRRPPDRGLATGRPLRPGFFEFLFCSPQVDIPFHERYRIEIRFRVQG